MQEANYKQKTTQGKERQITAKGFRVCGGEKEKLLFLKKYYINKLLQNTNGKVSLVRRCASRLGAVARLTKGAFFMFKIIAYFKDLYFLLFDYCRVCKIPLTIWDSKTAMCENCGYEEKLI